MRKIKNKPPINADERRFNESVSMKLNDDIHISQCLNYFGITGLKLCLLINFSRLRVEIKRIVNGI